MKKILVGVVMLMMVLMVSKGYAIEIKYSGEMVIQMIDAQGNSPSIDKFFYLGSVWDDPSPDHSFLQLQGVVNDDISATVKFNVSDAIFANITTTEEAYLTLKNVKGLPEGFTLKAGLFYIPMGLQTWKYTIDDIANIDDPITGNPIYQGPEVSYRTDTGVELTGASKEFNYKIAIVDGQLDNGRDIVARFATDYKKMPVGISYNRGKAGTDKLNNIGIDTKYNFSEVTSVVAEVIKYKEGQDKADLSYLCAKHKLNDAIDGYAKYYEISPKNLAKTKMYVIGAEYKYAENTTLKTEFISRDTGLAGNLEPDDNIYKAELKVKF